MSHTEIPIDSPITRNSRPVPKKPAGKFHRARVWVTVVLMGLFLVTPFIKIGGHSFLMLNFIERKFIILGQIFWPQDTHLLIFLLLIFFVFVILFTVVFGRVWCGWACPQTLFMEMVFRKIEYLIEGNAAQQKRLKQQPWTNEKIIRKTAKHCIFILISLLVSNVVLAYVVSMDQLIAWYANPSVIPAGVFIFMFAFSSIFYLVFTVIREYACTVICPYGRLQGVLINKETIVVAYDKNRGEPRGKLSRDGNSGLGDCVDCTLCVQVCPTGIDIRNGTQLECVHCTACIDACDDVMLKIGKPKGLIRYDSLHGLSGGKKLRIDARIIAYSTVLALLVGAFLYLITSRKNTETTVVRATGQLYQELANGQISNLYNIQVVNKTYDTITVTLQLKDQNGLIIRPERLVIAGQSIAQDVMLIEIPAKDIKQMKTPIEIDVISNDKVIESVSTMFLAPVAKP